MSDLAVRNLPQRPDTLLTIIFSRSSSPHYPMAVFLAKQATIYKRIDDEKDDKKAIHLSIFTKDKAQAGHAAALLKIIGNWKNTQIHTSSKILADPFEVSQTLECYFQSLALGDHRAHCLWTGTGAIGHEGVVYPCQQLNSWIEFECRKHDEQRALKIPMKDRVLDLAMRKSCDWCPNFDVNNYVEPPKRLE